MDITAPAAAALGRILCLHPDGSWSVFADNLHAAFGLQYLEGHVYVLHNPKFTRFRDNGRTGTERVDLIEQTNPNPWALDWNDHVPANFRLGMDGYFYVAIGDKGLYGCMGRDGSRVDLHGGGILRLRPDATELEVFSTGVRNILDVALTSEDELFTYDNTDEHQWMGRLTHMVDGGFYGYPHDFIPRRPYTLWMMHDFGAGAACGAFAYTEDALPEEFHGNLFLADFGKRQVTRVGIGRDGATYRATAIQDLFRDMPGDFRPVGIAPTSDGLGIYICDWQHRDTKADVEVGRLWKLQWTGVTHATAKPAWYVPTALGNECRADTRELVEALDHPSREVRLTAQRALVARGGNQARRERTDTLAQRLAAVIRGDAASARARWHALWALAALDPTSARGLAVPAASDSDVSVARQALRLLGEMRASAAVPVLMEKLQHVDASIRFHAATALGRIGDRSAVAVLRDAMVEPDAFARYAMFNALARIGRRDPAAWPDIVHGLASGNPAVRDGTTFALRDNYSLELVHALNELTRASDLSAESREAALRALANLHYQVVPWRGEWWAYHPAKAPAPARTVSWHGTRHVLEALTRALADPEAAMRRAAIEGLEESREGKVAPQLRRLFAEDPDNSVRRAALRALASLEDREAAPQVAAAIDEPATSAELLAQALALAPRFDAPETRDALIRRLASVRTPVESRRAAVTALAELREPRAIPGILSVLQQADETFALRAIEALGRIGGQRAKDALRLLLRGSEAGRRRAAVRALGELGDRNSVVDLLEAWRNPDTRPDAVGALLRFSDLRALDAYIDGLGSADPLLRERSRRALAPIRDKALPMLERQASGLSATVLSELRQLYSDDPAALASSLFVQQSAIPDAADYERHARADRGDPARGERLFFDEAGVACIRCHALDGAGGGVGPDLSLAGEQFSRDQLIESILYPSRAVREGYQQVIIETRGGDVFAGALKADTADEVTLIDGAGQTHHIPRETILNRESSNQSLMPEGLHIGLSLDEFADLLAYLESRKSGIRAKAPETP
jgi:putative heme-binding domain-containing protein